MKSFFQVLLSVAACAVFCLGQCAHGAFMEIRDGYFFDAEANDTWVPHGIAYQTWNRPLGVWQTKAQIDYDLDEMAKMGANSVRIDIVWQHVEEDADDEFKWENYDYFINACEQRGLKIFALIGYQWPPNWFPDEWYTMHPPEIDAEGIEHTNRWQSDIINYEHPQARAEYAEWIGAVCARYKDSKAIAGWIVGNEYGYLGLWSGLPDGYDPETEQAFRDWCGVKYGTIANVNASWGTSYTNLAAITFVEQYRAYGAEGAQWADMVQFREDSIAEFTALSAAAAKTADTNHLISYSTVGMQWGEEDWRYHAEDRGKITAAAAARGAPIDFFSVNNYPWSVLGHEAQNGQWGISYTKKVAGVPVLYSETGFTSSESMWPGMNELRQGPLIRNSLWESLEAGAIGTHIFTWQDRPYITDREKGFGILYANRAIKPAFWVSRLTFGLMDQMKIGDLLRGSKDPKPDIAFLWTAANDSQYNRYECEMQQIAGAFERLGYEPNFMNLQDLAAGAYTNFRMVVLPRNMRVESVVPGHTNSVLNFLLTRVLPAGVHVLASADLPGMQGFNGKPRPEFAAELDALFGIDASDAGGYEMPQRRRHYVSWYWKLIEVDFNSNAVGAVANGYHYWPHVWKYSDEIEVTDGTIWATMDTLRNKGFEDSNTSVDRWDGTWGSVLVRSGWGWAYEGNNMVQMWGDAGMYADFPVVPFGRYTHSAFLRSNSDDPLRGGKEAFVSIEWYDEDGTKIGVAESAPLTTNTPGNSWVRYAVDAIAPSNAWTGRRIVRIVGAGDGSVYVDGRSRAPAIVVKSHGPAKAAIFLYSAGDMKPDGNLDGDPDIYAWQWRYDVFGSIARDCFGVQPRVSALGANAYLCLAESRDCADGSTLWQVKNYLYQTNSPNGGAPQTFTLTSDLFLGKTVRAFDQAKIIEKVSDGTIELTLDPDGMEMLHVYPPKTNDIIVQLADSPGVIHPFGDKNYQVVVKFDTAGASNVVIKVALMSPGTTNKIIQTLEFTASGSGTTNLYLYIPDPDTTDPDLVSTPDGGTWVIAAWPEDAAGNPLAEAVAQPTELDWGVTPTGDIPTTVDKGSVVEMPVEWQQLYESLPWQNTPMVRADAFPDRVAIFRSTKTEALHPGHFARVNAVCDWLESMGYEAGNGLDVSFDNVSVTLGSGTNASGGPTIAFSDDMELGTNGWTAEGMWHQAADLAYSPSHSWAYNNGLNYNNGARNSGSLTTPWMDLTNASAATLIFRSWYETEDTGTFWDKKLVSVSTDGSNWVQVLQVSGANRQWVAQTLDLSAYAGRSVRVRFTFDTIDSVYNQFKGWYIDDVRVTSIAGGTVDVFADDMQGTTNWVGDGLWHLSTNRAASATQSWAYNNGTHYDNGARNSGALVSRWIDLTGVASARLSFRSWYQTEDTGTSWDRKVVSVSLDGTNWAPLVQISGANLQWVAQDLDLSAYSGHPIKLRFFFDTIDAVGNAFEGWYIDDVRITTVGGDMTGAAIFTENAESGTNGWLGTGLWHVASDLSTSPSHSWAYNNGVNYNTGARNTGALVSPWIDLTGAASATLTFRSWYETETTATTWDRKTIHVSADGTNWAQILQVSGTDRQWTTQTADLSAFAGQRIRIRFLFDSIDGLYNSFRGWYVDDISVKIIGTDLLFFDGFDSAGLSAWQHVAGAANWDVSAGALRASRIGNSDNMVAAGSLSWSNYTVSADIRYNQQGPYYNDAELYLRTRNRDNFVKVGIRNSVGFWRLKYTVRAGTNNVAQGWLHEFSKTNRPVENAWYNLKVKCEGDAFTVFFNDEPVGGFTATNFASGRIAVGTMAAQLGNWEPARGYFFIDDDEYSFWAPEGQPQTQGKPLNLDWGYLTLFFPTLVLPSTYVMSDVEIVNIETWLLSGMFSLIATDGGVAMENETGVADPGRIEHLFGVAPSISGLGGLNRITVGTNNHYVTMDYRAGDQLPVAASANAWTELTTGKAAGWIDNGSQVAPALIVNTLADDPWSPKKVFCFNFGADVAGQLTGSCSNVARRAFEWARGQAHRVRVLLKYEVHPGEAQYDITVAQWDTWALGGNGSTNLSLYIPDDGIMTGSNLYWVIYTYPWDTFEPWAGHDGFYTSQNDGGGLYTKIDGLGLQIFGGPDKVFGGRVWDLWMGYNTQGEGMTLHYGLKEKGSLQDEDNFDDGNYGGWTVQPVPNYRWSVSNQALHYTSPSAGGCSWLTKNGLDVADKNITIEYDVRFMDDAEEGGLIYRGQVLNLSPWSFGWTTNSPLDMTSGVASNFSGLVTNADGSVSYIITGTVTVHIGPPYITQCEWHHVMVSIRDGDPYLLSDIYVDGKVLALAEPLKSTNFSSTGVGILSPYRYGYAEWDNFRVTDEEYSFVTQSVVGVYVPTNAVTPFWPYVPDYDPEMWEYDGTAMGGQYQWYAYLKGKDAHAGFNVGVFFAPRLMVENVNFPTTMNAGDTVYVPVEWEELPTAPTKLHLELVDPYAGAIAVSQDYTITSKTGSATFPATVSAAAGSSANYLWAAYIYAVDAADPFGERIGLDDTFRFNTQGQPVGPETRITVIGSQGSDDEITIYNDLGLLAGCDVFTWHGSTTVFDGNYTNIPPPEGVKAFRTSGSSWAGWGIFSLDLGMADPRDLRDYTNGFLRFWVRSAVTLKVGLEDTAGRKREKYIPSTTNAWKEVTIPISDFGGVDLSQMYGLFEITAETATSFYIDDVRWVKGVYRVYRDAGIPEGSDVIVWDGGTATFDGDYIDMSAPEGIKTFRTEGTSWAGWGVTITNGTVDLRLYSNGVLTFWARSTTALKLEMEASSGEKGTTYISSTGGAWQEFAVPIVEFGGVNLAQIKSPFLVTAEVGTTFFIDDVRWMRGTNAVAAGPKSVVYSEAGIPMGTDVFVWWASQYWDHVSILVGDGGFEASAPGSFPDSGFWSLASAQGGGSAVCLAASARSLFVGLRASTGNNASDYWVSTYQEYTGYAGDIYQAETYVRQPSGSAWTAGSEARLRLQFLDAWHQVLSNVLSAAKVTTAGQGWTLCAIPDTPAPFGTRYVRVETLVTKPNGLTGVSTADFDDCRFRQGNSFNGEFAEDPTPPEGTKVFRSYCVNWSGWGIFYTNTTVDMSAYSNGTLKFWLKSSGYTKVEIQSQAGSNVQTAAGAYYQPTTNEAGTVVWQQKVIPITNFAGVALASIKSPFMVTDPTVDQSYSIDYVRWEMGP